MLVIRNLSLISVQSRTYLTLFGVLVWGVGGGLNGQARRAKRDHSDEIGG